MIAKEIKKFFKNISIELKSKNRIIIKAEKDQVLNILSFLKNKGFDHLALISCVDWIKEKEFEIVYILTTYTADNTHIILKTRIPRNRPQFITVTGLFENAEPYEREIYELFGIKFEGHKRLKPLFLYHQYKIPPFRKDFDTRKYVKEFFGSIPPVPSKEKGK